MQVSRGAALLMTPAIAGAGAAAVLLLRIWRRNRSRGSGNIMTPSTPARSVALSPGAASVVHAARTATRHSGTQAVQAHCCSLLCSGSFCRQAKCSHHPAMTPLRGRLQTIASSARTRHWSVAGSQRVQPLQYPAYQAARRHTAAGAGCARQAGSMQPRVHVHAHLRRTHAFCAAI